MDAFSLPAVVVGVLFLIVLLGLSRPSAPPPAPAFVVMPATAEPNGGCGVSLVIVLLTLIAFAMAANLLGLFPLF